MKIYNYIESQKMIYNEIDNKVFTQSETFLGLENKYDIKFFKYFI